MEAGRIGEGAAAEVRDLDLGVRGGIILGLAVGGLSWGIRDQDVGGLQIFVKDADIVGGGYGAGDADENLQT